MLCAAVVVPAGIAAENVNPIKTRARSTARNPQYLLRYTFNSTIVGPAGTAEPRLATCPV